VIGISFEDISVKETKEMRGSREYEVTEVFSFVCFSVS
jgi:hypothetical protein